MPEMWLADCQQWHETALEAAPFAQNRLAETLQKACARFDRDNSRVGAVLTSEEIRKRAAKTKMEQMAIPNVTRGKCREYQDR